MTDVLISAVNEHTRNLRGPIWVDDLTGYVFGNPDPPVSSSYQLAYWKTLDGGRTWSDPVYVSDNADSFGVYAIWWDQWTEGDLGSLIYAVWSVTEDPGGNNYKKVRFCTLDTDTDTLSSVSNIYDGLIVDHFGSDSSLAIAKTASGTLYAAIDIANGRETGLYRSTDAGVTWRRRANPFERDRANPLSHRFLLRPSSLLDSEDIWLVYWSNWTTQITLKHFDESVTSVEIEDPSDNAREIAGTVVLHEDATNAIGNFFVGATNQYYGFRFELNIPQGATIVSAILTYTWGSSASLDKPDSTIYMEDSDDAAAFTTAANNISSRALTTATVNYASSDLGFNSSTHTRFTFPELKDLLQEVVNRIGWDIGNHAVVIAQGSASGGRWLGMRRVSAPHSGVSAEATGEGANLTVTWV